MFKDWSRHKRYAQPAFRGVANFYFLECSILLFGYQKVLFLFLDGIVCSFTMILFRLAKQACLFIQCYRGMYCATEWVYQQRNMVVRIVENAGSQFLLPGKILPGYLPWNILRFKYRFIMTRLYAAWEAVTGRRFFHPAFMLRPGLLFFASCYCDIPSCGCWYLSGETL